MVASLLAAGVLAVTTQISFGCPGPVRADQPQCESWHAFPHAQFSVGRPGAAARVYESDAAGTLRLRLPAGVYVLTPVRQVHTLGGTSVRVRVRAGGVTAALLRFVGFPRML